MKTIPTLALASLIGATLVTSAVAQQASPPRFNGALPQSGYGVDIWSFMTVKKMDHDIRRITDKESWDRAERAAQAINAGKCGEAAVIAAQANDLNLMNGVKRACRYQPQAQSRD